MVWSCDTRQHFNNSCPETCSYQGHQRHSRPLLLLSKTKKMKKSEVPIGSLLLAIKNWRLLIWSITTVMATNRKVLFFHLYKIILYHSCLVWSCRWGILLISAYIYIYMLLPRKLISYTTCLFFLICCEAEVHIFEVLNNIVVAVANNLCFSSTLTLCLLWNKKCKFQLI